MIHAVFFTLDLQSRPLSQSSRAQKTYELWTNFLIFCMLTRI